MRIIPQGIAILSVQMDNGLTTQLGDVSPNVHLILTFMDTRRYVTSRVLIQDFMQKTTPGNAWLSVQQEAMLTIIISDAWMFVLWNNIHILTYWQVSLIMCVCKCVHNNFMLLIWQSHVYQSVKLELMAKMLQTSVLKNVQQEPTQMTF